MEPFYTGQYGRFDTVHAGTRYFTSRRDDPTGNEVRFDRLVDPKGVMESLTNGTYFHGDDNEVLYYILTDDNKGSLQ